MEKLPLEKTAEQRRNELRALIDEKKKFAIYDDQYDDLFESIDQYESLLHEGVELTEQEEEDYERKKNRLDSFSIQVQTLPELRFILEELGKTETEIRRDLAHENAHANVAHSLGANHERYTVYLLKNGDILQTRITFPDHLTPEEVEDISVRAINAPEEYGDGGGLSDDDKRKLLKFDK